MFLHIKLREEKIKTSQDKINFCNADADADVNADADAEMLMPIFPNGLQKAMFYWNAKITQCKYQKQSLRNNINKKNK